MMSFVIDASVIVKWIFPERAEEEHLPQALQLLYAIRQGAIKVLQPPHWLAETAAVIVRLRPKIANNAIELLDAMDFPIFNDSDMYRVACRLSERYSHHLFDTLYHAVALESGHAQFVTADKNYYQKAAKQGAIIYLGDFSMNML